MNGIKKTANVWRIAKVRNLVAKMKANRDALLILYTASATLTAVGLFTALLVFFA